MINTAADKKIKYGSSQAAHLTTAANCNCQSPTTIMQQPVEPVGKVPPVGLGVILDEK
jgi:hypothetical protein